MFNTYFGEIKHGRLLRLSYLKYYVIMIVLMMAFVIGTGLMIGISEQIMGGDIQQAQDKLRAWFTLPFIIIVGVIMFAFMFAGANIAAKRVRDMGLPGWWVILGLFLVSGSISAVSNNQGQGGGAVGLIFLLALLFIPSNAFGKSNRL